MKYDSNMLTQEYTKNLGKKVFRIEKTAKARRIIRVVLPILIVILTAGGLFYGYQGKEKVIKERYRNYLENPTQSELDNELLAYEDVYVRFVEDFLYNEPEQLQMGGLFYSCPDYSIYPSKDGKFMVLSEDGSEKVLFNFLIDNINVRDNIIIFRKTTTRDIYLYDMTTRKKQALGINGVGQFVVCNGTYYYIDIKGGSLLRYDTESQESATLVDGDVVSFAIAGNVIMYLNRDHELHSYNISKHTDAIKGKNITSFIFNGTLWFQNGDSVYQQKLNSKRITEIKLGNQCNRLLGVVDSLIYYESSNGVFAFDYVSARNKQLGEGIWIGGTNDKCVLYDMENNTYNLIDTK